MADSEGSKLVMVSSADHGSVVSNALRRLFVSKRGTDFDLHWNGKSVRAHRIILELFLAPEILGTDEHVPVAVKPDKSDQKGNYSCLDSLLEFLYKGEVAVPENRLDDLLRVAEELDFQMLVDAVQASSFKNTELENVHQVDKTDCTERKLSLLSLESKVRTEKPSRKKFGRRSKSKAVPISHSQFPPVGKKSLSTNSNPQSERRSAGLSDSRAKRFKGEPEDCSADSESDRLPEEEVMGSVDLLQLQYSGDSSPHRSDDSSNWKIEDPNTKIWYMKVSGSRKVYKCQLCDFGTPKYMQLYSHLRLVHNLTVRGEPATKHKCPDCDFASFYRRNVRNHWRCKHTADRPFACPQCSYVGKQKRTLESHMTTIHGVLSKDEDTGKVYSCQYCGFETAKYRRYYDHHLSVHGLSLSGEPATKHQCPECDFWSFYSCNLKSHQRTKHAKEKPYACQHCSYSSTKRGMLNKHIKAFHSDAMSSALPQP